jgi:GT2 family glycosyltransferase/SAM-dependent methyltransferase
MSSAWHLLHEANQPYDPVYHEHARTDLLGLPLRTPRLVLDVGCAAGATARLLRERFPEAQVLGVELNNLLEARARESCAYFYCQPIEEFLKSSPQEWQGKIDTVILGDVLEHLVDPFACLQMLQPLLTDDAQLLVSLPNVRNIRVLEHLARGRFPYANAGILDITHLRFFTRREAELLFDEAGYVVSDVQTVPDGGVEGALTRQEGNEASTTWMTLRGITDRDFADLATLQFLFLLQRKGVRLKAGTECVADQEKATVLSPDELKRQKQFYHVWALQRTLTPVRRSAIEGAIERLSQLPRFHFCLFLGGEQWSLLRETCFALEAQLYSHWRLTILSFDPPPNSWKGHPNCHWETLGDDDDSLLEANRVLANSEADWVCVLNPGDRVPPEGLFVIAEEFEHHPEWSWIYSDEDKLTVDQERVDPVFKPDFNADLLRSLHYTGGLSLLRRTLFVEMGGFDPAFEGVEDYDLALRLAAVLPPEKIGHVADVLYHRHESGRISHLSEEETLELGRAALARHCDSLGWTAEIKPGPASMTWRVRYPLVTAPSVSILIPTKNHYDDLRRCVESVRNLTDYPNYSIVIIDNQSSDEQTLAYMKTLEDAGQAKIVRYDQPFNFSAMNNRAVELVDSDYVLLLNNDTAVLSGDWLRTLLGYAEVAGAGVVGPLLVYQNGRVQHAGVVIGLGNMPAEHVFIGSPPQASTVLNRLQLTQNYSAVTGACLLVRREDYLAVGGLDELNLPTTYQDIDFCLKVGKQLGKRVVWTPEVRLLHDGSKTFTDPQAQSVEETPVVEGGVVEKETVGDVQEESSQLEMMYTRWGEVIASDPAFNRNLSLDNRAAGIETEPLLTRSNLRFGPFVMASPADATGCGEYRIMAPMRALLNAGRVDGGLTTRILGPTEIMRMRPDVVVVQRQTLAHQTQAIARYQKRASSFVIYELDDLITVGWSKNPDENQRETITKQLRKALGSADRLVASTPRIAEEYGSWCKDTVIVPNYIPLDRWGGVQARRLGKDRPRVGWAGGASHAADLEMIADVVKILQHEVEWVFLGSCPEALRPYVHEFHSGVLIDGYPARLASMNLDLALAPLVDNDFNRARTALRVLECGVLGYPVIASDMPSFRMGFPITLVGSSVDDWVSAIRSMVADRTALAAAGDRLRQHILDHWTMDNNLDVWFNAWMPR